MTETKKTETRGRKKGAKEIYSDTFPALILEYASTRPEWSATYSCIAKLLGVSINNVAGWLRTKPAFKDAVRRVQAYTDARVESSLYDACFSHEITETKVETRKDGTEVVTTTTKTTPASVGAMRFWLVNRQPQNWKERVESDMVSGGEPIRPVIIFGKPPASEDADTGNKTNEE